MQTSNVLPLRMPASSKRSAPVVRAASPHEEADFAKRQATILNLALRIEFDREQCLRWFMHDGIAEFGYATADELLRKNMDERLMHFLLRVIRKERRGTPVY